MLGRFLWINGRNGRLQWWMTGIVQIAVFLLSLPFLLPDGEGGLAGLAGSSTDSLKAGVLATPALLPVFAVITWLGLVSNIRRYHDRNKSGWWLLFGFIPLIGALWQIIELGLLSGTLGDNDYGPAGGGGSVDSEIGEMRSRSAVLAKVDDDYLEEYARKYAAEQALKAAPAAAAVARASFGQAPSGGGAFGKRR
jgi:uncharacterized membrane protein YhaH (DUF805 family)